MLRPLRIGAYRIRHAYIRAFKLERALLGHCPIGCQHECRTDDEETCGCWHNKTDACSWHFIHRYIVLPDRERG